MRPRGEQSSEAERYCREHGLQQSPPMSEEFQVAYVTSHGLPEVLQVAIDVVLATASEDPCGVLRDFFASRAKQAPRDEEDDSDLPPVLRAFTPLNKMPAVRDAIHALPPLEVAVATDPDSAESSGALGTAISGALRVLPGAIESRISEAGFVPLCDDVRRVASEHVTKMYDATWSQIASSEDERRGLAAYAVKAAELSNLAAGHGAIQSARTVIELYTQAARVNAKYVELVRGVKTRVPNAELLNAGRLKPAARVLEKVLLRREGAGEVDRVCDVVRSTFVATCMDDLVGVLAQLILLARQEAIRVVRVKDRIGAPAGGWRDLLLNFFITADASKHVCEVVLVHRSMLVAHSKGLPGQRVYARARNAAELLERLGVEGEEGRGRRIADLRDAGVRLERLLKAGCSAHDLVSGRFPAAELSNAGVDLTATFATALDAVGGSISEILDAPKLSWAGQRWGAAAPAVGSLLGVLVSRYLVSLSLEKCHLGVEGARAVAAGLTASGRCSLTTLSLLDSSLDVPAVKALAGAVGVCASLAFLTLEGSPLPVKQLKGVEKVAALDLSGKGLGLLSTIMIACLLKENRSGSPERLDLTENNLVAARPAKREKVTGPRVDVGSTVGFEGAHYTVVKEEEEDGTLYIGSLVGVKELASSVGQRGGPLSTLVLDEATLPVGQLKGAEAVETVDMSYQRFGVVTSMVLGELLRANADGSLASLDLSGNDLGVTAFAYVAPAIARCRSLTALSVGQNRLGDEGVALLVKALREGEVGGLRTLDLNHYQSTPQIGAEGAQELASWLTSSKSLTKLDLSHNRIGPDGGVALAQVITSGSSLLEIDISDNQLTGHGVTAMLPSAMGVVKDIAVALSRGSVTSINLENNQLGPAGGMTIAEGIAASTSLRVINLAFNDISVEGAKAIAKAAATSPSLASVTIEGSALPVSHLKSTEPVDSVDLGRRGLRLLSGHVIAELIAANRGDALRSIDLRMNKLGPEGGRVLAAALASSPSLSRVDLSGNELGAEGAKAIADAIRTCVALKSIALGHNDLGAEGGKAIAAALADSKTLQQVDLSNNNLRREGAGAIAAALSSSKSLTSVQLSGNKLPADVVSMIRSAKGPALRDLMV